MDLLLYCRKVKGARESPFVGNAMVGYSKNTQCLKALPDANQS